MMNTNIVKVDFSVRGKGLYYLKKDMRVEKKEKRIDHRIQRMISNSK